MQPGVPGRTGDVEPNRKEKGTMSLIVKAGKMGKRVLKKFLPGKSTM